MNGLKTGLGITPGEHIISADSALSRNISEPPRKSWRLNSLRKR